MLRPVLSSRPKTRALCKEILEEFGEQEIARLEKRIGILSTVATIAPLLGLLGTITGMIEVFREVSSQLNPAIGALAGGIWGALITTAAGLVVAIPSYVGYRILLGRIEGLSLALADQCHVVLSKLYPEEFGR